jgi:hypothetical protein
MIAYHLHSKLRFTSFIFFPIKPGQRALNAIRMLVMLLHAVLFQSSTVHGECQPRTRRLVSLTLQRPWVRGWENVITIHLVNIEPCLPFAPSFDIAERSMKWLPITSSETESLWKYAVYVLWCIQIAFMVYYSGIISGEHHILNASNYLNGWWLTS